MLLFSHSWYFAACHGRSQEECDGGSGDAAGRGDHLKEVIGAMAAITMGAIPEGNLREEGSWARGKELHLLS